MDMFFGEMVDGWTMHKLGSTRRIMIIDARKDTTTGKAVEGSLPWLDDMPELENYQRSNYLRLLRLIISKKKLVN